MSSNIPPPPPPPTPFEDKSFKPKRTPQKTDEIPFGRYAIYSTKNPYGWVELRDGRNNIIFLYDIEHSKSYNLDRLKNLNFSQIPHINNKNTN